MRTDPAATHVLSSAVATILPGPHDTLLLRGCLLPGDSGRDALRTWLAGQGDVTAALTRPSLRWLLPLVFRACRVHAVLPGAPVLTLLRTAAVREELRTQSYRAIARRALTALAAAGLTPIVLKGAALADTVYPEPALRHSHDIELLFASPVWTDVVAAVAGAGFSAGTVRAGAARVELVHPSGLPLVLRRHLFHVPFHDAVLETVRARAEVTTVAGTSACALAPADGLLHVCGHAAHSASRESCRWIADAWFLIDRRRDLDWDLLVQTARQAYLSLPLAVSLTYLAEALDAPIPADALERATAAARDDRSIGPELALFGARSAARGGFRQLIRSTPGVRGRLRILRTVVLPSPAYLAWATKTGSTWFLPAQYAYGPARYLARRARRFLERSLGGRARMPPTRT